MNPDETPASTPRSPRSLTLNIEGMTCPGCAAHVQEALARAPGVIAAQVPGWQSGKAIVRMKEDARVEDLIRAVEEAGYRAVRPEPAAATPVLAADDDLPAFIPSPAHDYDLIVIGTGGGGMAAAIRGAEQGARVAIIEAGTIGGTCVNIGCVPSKVLIRAAEQARRAAHSPFAGVHTRLEGVDWPAIRAQKDARVEQLRREKYIDVLAAYPDRITLIRGWARLTPDRQVAVGDRVLSARAIVIATGARPRILPIPGVKEVDVLDSTSAMALEALPESMIVLGGRAVALELGQMFARLGVRVTILQRSPRILPEHEPEISEALTGYLQDEGVRVVTGVGIQALRRRGDKAEVKAKLDGQSFTLKADAVLMAAGRTPNSAGMGLEEAGVELDAGGFIVVDEHLRTSAAGVYAVGDVTTLPKFVYTAAAAGGVAASHALGDADARLDLTGMPAVVFTDPAVATAGLTEAQARTQGRDVSVSILEMQHVPRALAAFDTRGLIKLVADPGADQLLGANILAPEAGEMIQTASLAIRFGLPLSQFRDALYPYLTNVEGLKLAALAFDKDPAMLSCCAG